MADFTVIPDSNLEPGKPIRSVDGIALRDNPIAITEGATGAPRIIGAASKRLVDYPVLAVSAADTYSANTLSTRVEGTLSTSSTTYVTAYTLTVVLGTGVIRFKAAHAAPSGGFTSLRISKNASPVDTWSLVTTTPVLRTKDVAVVPGDVITWEHYVSSGTYTSVVSDVNEYADDSYVERPLYIAASAFSTP